MNSSNGPILIVEDVPNVLELLEVTLRFKGYAVIIGGGETVALAQELGLADRYAHVSTGGGASLEFLEGRELPGVAALLDR